MQNKKLSEWKHLAEKELRGKKLESLNVETAEGIDIKPLYTETADLRLATAGRNARQLAEDIVATLDAAAPDAGA